MKNTLAFDVRNIKDGNFNNHEVEIPTSQIDLNIDEVDFLSPVRGLIQLLRHSEDNIYVKADVKTVIELQCGKCLESFTTDIDATFEVQFSPNPNPEQSETEDIEDGERYYDGETFDISDDTRRALAIQIPIWPLCSQMCEGLCYNCGANLNTEDCICEDIGDLESDVSELTSPFANLSQMLETAKLGKQSKLNNKERNTKNGSSKT